jgi:hypothetical protein
MRLKILHNLKYSLTYQKPMTTEEIEEIESYKDMLLAVEAETDQAILDNQLLIDTINYEQALQRLVQYELSAGRPERTVYKTDILGSQEIDYVIPAIDPIDTTIEQHSYSATG